MAPKISLKRGFTLVELMIVVAIIGVLAALAIYGVRQYVNSAKSAEGRASVGAIAKGAAASYDREIGGGEVLAADATSAAMHDICDTVAATPTEVPEGVKVQTAAADWEPWTCLRFSMKDAQYFQYEYEKVGTGDGATFTAIARSDLTGTGDPTLELSLKGEVRDGAVTVATNILEEDLVSGTTP